jgi:hypothetical protein
LVSGDDFACRIGVDQGEVIEAQIAHGHQPRAVGLGRRQVRDDLVEEQGPIRAAEQISLTGAVRSGSSHADDSLLTFHFQIEGRLAVGVDKATDVLHRIPELAPMDVLSWFQMGAVGKGGGHSTV